MSTELMEISVPTPRREELVDITSEVAKAVSDARAVNGTVMVYCPHTTAGITINENADPSVKSDIINHLAKLVPHEADFKHGEGNSDAHIKASMMGLSCLVPLENGRLRLGTWQSIYLAEFDGPRKRKIIVKII